jgi:hypothetical protein
MRCERWGKNSVSLHAEGRAVDWHLDAARTADRREARRLIDLWLAPDSEGNEHVLARRMGYPGDHLELPFVVVRIRGHGEVLRVLHEERQSPQEREPH